MTAVATHLAWPGAPRATLFGVVAAAAAAPLIVWTNAFPSGPAESDSEYSSTYAVGYVLLLLYLVAAGAFGSWKTRRLASGAWAGAATALIAVAVVMAAFGLVDNLFLDVVSRQPDKIAAFHNGGYHSMRESINAGLLTGAIYGIPFVTVVGAGAGTVGALLSRILRGGGRQTLQRPTTAS